MKKEAIFFVSGVTALTFFLDPYCKKTLILIAIYLLQQASFAKAETFNLIPSLEGLPATHDFQLYLRLYLM